MTVAFTTPLSLSPAPVRRRRHAPVCSLSHPPSAPPASALASGLARWGATPLLSELFPLHADPPLLRACNLVPAETCAALIARQRDARGEASLYLNARVNAEVARDGASGEAGALLDAWGVEEETLDHGARSGFRTAVPREALGEVLPRVERVLGLEGREAVFEEGLWVRPSARTYVIRDVTVVHYRAGEGVSPHVDGKDATVLVYLTGEGDAACGGATCFPEVGVCVAPVMGDALVYWSKKELLHYAERVRKGEKWVLQFLIDFKVREDEADVDFRTGTVYKG